MTSKVTQTLGTIGVIIKKSIGGEAKKEQPDKNPIATVLRGKMITILGIGHAAHLFGVSLYPTYRGFLNVLPCTHNQLLQAVLNKILIVQKIIYICGNYYKYM
tara:strand:+ start:232 stop:540 length:309 start_codon:yes stop_codon:yes gene_type:complete